MHTVRVVNGERLETYSGASLVQWATATYGGPPFTYMATEHANRLSIVITHGKHLSVRVLVRVKVKVDILIS